MDNNSNNILVQGFLFEEFSEEEAILNLDDLLVSYDANMWKITPNVFFVKSENSSEIIVAGYNVKLSKKSERLLIKDGEKIFYEVPFFKITNINIQSKGVTITSDLIEECVKRGIIINFNSFNGKPYAILSSPSLNAVIKTRREQIKAYNDERGVIFAKKVVYSKIKNQMNLVKYFIKNETKEEKLDYFRDYFVKVEGILKNIEKIPNLVIDKVRSDLFSNEAHASKRYWECIKNIISEKIDFNFREKRGATDPVNSLLNYGYGMLYSLVWGAVLNAGLEPFAGFLHIDEPGRPSLILDIVEEFRAPVIDRVVVSYIKNDCKIELENGLLTLATRKEFSQKVIERFESYDTYNGKRFKIKSIIQIHCRNIASFFREGRDYKSFSFKW